MSKSVITIENKDNVALVEKYSGKQRALQKFFQAYFCLYLSLQLLIQHFNNTIAIMDAVCIHRSV